MIRHVVLLLLGAHLASAGTHSLRYVYTGVSGLSDFPEFTAVGLVDEGPFIYFDSKTKEAVPKTEWISQNEGADYWTRETQNHIDTHQIFRNNIQIAMKRFNQTTGVHTSQVMYGCDWDDQTGETNGFRQFGYDGEDFVFLDSKEMRFISPVQQGIPTAQKWNNDRGLIESGKNYLRVQCIKSLQKYLEYGKSSLQKTVSPQVSLLQKSSSSPVMCHATGFYPKEVTISWMKNDQEHHEDVKVGELLPNEDGTFQKMSELRVTPEEWKKNKFICVVEHQGKTKTEDEIRTNPGAPGPFGVIFSVIAVILLAVFAVIGFLVYRKQNCICPFNQNTVERTITTNPQTFTTSTGTTKTNISEQEKALIQKKPDDGDSSSSSLTGQ